MTIGTLDGANIEIREAVGEEKFFAFGMTAHEVHDKLAKGYDPWEIYHRNPDLPAAIDMMRGGFFSAGDPGTFEPLFAPLFYGGNRFLVLADFADYAACQAKVSCAYLAQDDWIRKSILNVASAGQFSSDQSYSHTHATSEAWKRA